MMKVSGKVFYFLKTLQDGLNQNSGERWRCQCEKGKFLKTLLDRSINGQNGLILLSGGLSKTVTAHQCRENPFKLEQQKINLLKEDKGKNLTSHLFQQGEQKWPDSRIRNFSLIITLSQICKLTFFRKFMRFLRENGQLKYFWLPLKGF